MDLPDNNAPLAVEYSPDGGFKYVAQLSRARQEASEWWELDDPHNALGNRHTWDAWVRLAHLIIERDIQRKIEDV